MNLSQLLARARTLAAQSAIPADGQPDAEAVQDAIAAAARLTEAVAAQVPDSRYASGTFFPGVSGRLMWRAADGPREDVSRGRIYFRAVGRPAGYKTKWAGHCCSLCHRNIQGEPVVVEAEGHKFEICAKCAG